VEESVGVTSNGLTRADTNDRGMLDVVGFDTSASSERFKDTKRNQRGPGVKVSARALDPLELQVVSLKESINIGPNYGIST